MWMVYRMPLYSINVTLDPNQALSNKRPPVHERCVACYKAINYSIEEEC